MVIKISIKNINMKMNKNYNYFEDIKDTLFEPNLLIDILIRFILISSLIYILYKFFIVDITISHLINQYTKHLEIYLPNFKINTSHVISPEDINIYLTNKLNSLINLPANNNPDTNDKNFSIIYTTFIVGLLILTIIIIILSGGFRLINYKNIGYTFLFNIVFIIISQLLFFYLIYSYIDPWTIYKLFYYDYILNEPNTQSKIGPETTQTNTKELNTIINTDRDKNILIDSQKTATIYAFLVIFMLLTIIFLIIIVLNLLLVYKKYRIYEILIPLSKFTLPIYSIAGFVFLFLFIIMILLFTSRI